MPRQRSVRAAPRLRFTNAVSIALGPVALRYHYIEWSADVYQCRGRKYDTALHRTSSYLHAERDSRRLPLLHLESLGPGLPHLPRSILR
jgi:hypothetical protein